MDSEIVKINSDGLELVAESFGSGPPLIAAHGLTGNRHITGRQLKQLANRYRIIVYDQRGHSDSTPVTNPSLYNPDRMAEDMRAVAWMHMASRKPSFKANRWVRRLPCSFTLIHTGSARCC
ncbi:MAG: alpha/beta fold hydrolase [Chloroflexi bacterium]|uniref:alpha/beta fold hydrolase n=1 Tax=Candidatus Flexifilum breve TaxID=3140694 RepID=UPI00313505C1|nr:alpha/beta fold hydrolase [Chloroflexota bacterium]